MWKVTKAAAPLQRVFVAVAAATNRGGQLRGWNSTISFGRGGEETAVSPSKRRGGIQINYNGLPRRFLWLFTGISANKIII